MQSRRLDVRAWVDAALEVLAEQGIDGVRIEPLAKRLSVTKGSFYWHFKDRDALFEAILADWRQRTTLDVASRIDAQAAPPAERLRQYLLLPFRGRRAQHGAGIELAIRLWGRHDPRAKQVLEEVDQIRLRNLETLIIDAGVRPAEATIRAVCAYSFMRVAGTLAQDNGPALVEDCVALLLAPATASAEAER